MIIDSLIYVMRGDTTEIQSGLAKGTASMDDAEKAAQKLDKTVKAATDNINKHYKILAAAAAAMAGVVVAKIKAMADQQAEYVFSLGQVSSATGIAIADLDAFGMAIQRAGGNQEIATRQLVMLMNAMGKAAINAKGEVGKSFSRLGVSIRDAGGGARSAVEVMGDLADAIQGLDRDTATASLRMLGIIDEKTISILYRGRDSINEMMATQRKYGRVSAENIKRANEYKESQRELAQTWGDLQHQISMHLLPILKRSAESIGKLVTWITDNSSFVLAFFGSLSTILMARFLPAVLSAAAGVWTLVSPFLLTAAAIGAVALVIALIADEIYHFVKGNESYIGDMAKKWPWIGEVAKSIYKVVSGILKLLTGDFEGAWDTIMDGIGQFVKVAGRGLMALGRVIGEAGKAAWAYLTGLFSQIVDAVSAWVSELIGYLVGKAGDVWDAITSPFVRAYDYIVAMFERLKAFIGGIMDFAKDAVDIVSGAAGNIGGKIKGVFGFGGEGGGGAVPSAKAYIGGVASSPINSISSSSIQNSRSSRQTVDVGNITIQTQATNAAGIANDIKTELTKALDSLQAQTASGVAI